MSLWRGTGTTAVLGAFLCSFCPRDNQSRPRDIQSRLRDNQTRLLEGYRMGPGVLPVLLLREQPQPRPRDKQSRPGDKQSRLPEGYRMAKRFALVVNTVVVMSP